MVTAHGILETDRVLVEDAGQASTLEQKGAYGRRRDAGLALDLHEAAYLVEADRLVVHDGDRTVSVAELVAQAAGRHERFETEHLVYRDHRSRGYVLRRGDEELDAWSRGAKPPEQAPSTLLAARGEADPASPADLLSLVARARGLGRGLLVGVVDEESDVTYYEADLAHVTGEVEDPAPELASQARARVLRDRAILETDPGLTGAGYGHEVGELVFCSLAETYHLAREGLELVDSEGDELAVEDVTERARRTHAAADEALGAYRWLRDRDLVPKTGFKFGVHYRVYEDEPGASHAPYLVQAMPTDAFMTFRDVARFVRLAHSVKKRPIVWTPDGALMIAWTRP